MWEFEVDSDEKRERETTWLKPQPRRRPLPRRRPPRRSRRPRSAPASAPDRTRPSRSGAGPGRAPGQSDRPRCVAAQLMDSKPETVEAYSGFRFFGGVSDRAFHHHLLDLGDGFGRVEPLGAGLGAVQDCVAAVEAERILQIVEPLTFGLVAAVAEPAVGLEQDGGTEIAVAVPPVARARGGAAGAPAPSRHRWP